MKTKLKEAIQFYIKEKKKSTNFFLSYAAWPYSGRALRVFIREFALSDDIDF